MRIAILTWEAIHAMPIGGVSVHTYGLALGLVKAGHEVHLFTRKGPNQALQDFVFGIYYHRIPLAGEGYFVDQVARFNRSLGFYLSQSTVGGSGFDIIHAHDWLCFEGGMTYALERGVPLVATFHATEKIRNPAGVRAERGQQIIDLELRTCEASAGVIAVSHAVRKDLEATYHTADWKTRVIYHGVRLTSSGNHLEFEKLPAIINPEKTTFLYVGSLCESKRPMLFLEAAELSLKSIPDLQFAVVGDGPLHGAVKKKIDKLNSVGTTTLLFTDLPGVEINALLKFSRAICLPYALDLHGIMALKAWASHKPVIVAAGEGTANEFVQDGTNGILSAAEPEAFGNAILRLAGDQDYAEWMGRNGHVAVESAFSWERMATSASEVYMTAISSTENG